MMSKKSPTLSNSDMTFYDNYVPSLKAGEYKITVSQKLTKDGSSPSIPSAPQAPVTQTFQVRGPRFTLDPADVHRMFPPPNGTGLYDVYLPMLVFNKRALPWERELTLKSKVKYPTHYPWMALLVFSEDELLIPQPSSGTVPSPPSGSQKNPTRSASFPLTDVIHPPSGILGPTLTLEADENPNTIQVNVIDISVDTFSGLIPTIDDLRFLAHVRQVSTENKEPQQATHDGWYSAVISNRFAIPPLKSSATKGYKNIVHLVSLEGFETHLGTAAPVKPSGYQKVRFISLASWTFTCLPDPAENFRTLMLNLISKSSEQGTDLLLRMPISATPLTESSLAHSGTMDVQQNALTRLIDGFVPLSYAARTGEETFAWYRGPMTPVVMKPFLKEANPDQPANSTTPQNPSEAMVYDPSTGLFDQSYAVAFQTGRSLALASKPFATNLLQWRREAHTLIDLVQEYLRSPHLKGILYRDAILDENGNLTNVHGCRRFGIVA